MDEKKALIKWAVDFIIWRLLQTAFVLWLLWLCLMLLDTYTSG